MLPCSYVPQKRWYREQKKKAEVRSKSLVESTPQALFFVGQKVPKTPIFVGQKASVLSDKKCPKRLFLSDKKPLFCPTNFQRIAYFLSKEQCLFRGRAHSHLPSIAVDNFSTSAKKSIICIRCIDAKHLKFGLCNSAMKKQKLFMLKQ